MLNSICRKKIEAGKNGDKDVQINEKSCIWKKMEK